MARVRGYISSTFQDLEDCRAEVLRALARIRVQGVAMESYVAEPSTPLERCLQDAADCDLYIGVFAWRYGFIPPGQDLSITELEYRAAVAAGKPALVFLLKEDAPWPRSMMDRDPASIEALRADLSQNLLCSFFSSKEELAALITAAVSNQLPSLTAKSGSQRQDGLPAEERAAVLAGKAFAQEQAAHLARLVQRYQRVDLEVLTPLSSQGEHPPMLLGRVFVPQMVRADPPPVELPRELLRRLAQAGEISERDLPAGVDREALEQARRVYQERPARPVLDVAAEPGGRKLVLLGDPGAGKSTLGRYLMLTHATGPTPKHPTGGDAPAHGGELPLLVELRTFASPPWRDGTFLDLIGHLHETEGLGLPRQMLESYLRQGGPALVVLDGLDEVFDPGLRERVTRQIEAFAARYPQARVIVTSRVIGYRRAILDGAGFAHWMLQDLDPGQIRDFTTAWYQASWPANPAEAARLRERLLAAVRNSPAVAELAGNPMLLTILAIIGRRQELPRDRRAVYQHAVSVLAEHWDATGKHLKGQDRAIPFLGPEDKLELLRLVARRMQDGPAGLAGNHLPGQDLYAEFESYLRQRFELPAVRAIPGSPRDAEAAAGAEFHPGPFRRRRIWVCAPGLPGIPRGRRHLPAVRRARNHRERPASDLQDPAARSRLARSPDPSHWHDPGPARRRRPSPPSWPAPPSGTSNQTPPPRTYSWPSGAWARYAGPARSAPPAGLPRPH